MVGTLVSGGPSLIRPSSCMLLLSFSLEFIFIYVTVVTAMGIMAMLI